MEGIPSFDSKENATLNEHVSSFFDVAMNRNPPPCVTIVGRGVSTLSMVWIIGVGGIGIGLFFAGL